MFELFLPYFIASALGISPQGEQVTSDTAIEVVAEATPELSARIPEDQTPTGKFTTAGEVKPILGMTKGNWVAVRNYEGQDLLYFTHLMSWRCGIWDVKYGLNGAEATEVFDMEPCYADTATPNSMLMPDGQLPFLSFEENSIESITVELTYDDGTADTAVFERSAVQIP